MTTALGKLLAGPDRLCLDFGDVQIFPVHAWELLDGGIAWVEPPAPAGAPDGTAAAHAVHGPLVPAPDGVGGLLALPGGGTVQARRAGADERGKVAAAQDPRSRAAARAYLLFWHHQLVGQLIEPGV